mmetsp:Transcript_13456/g.18410  ORF Transcript_13456/g.18410 Transcript_13456/m.18410 type:complete len:258 (-) Transcript_13456:1897-2670(-)|eukprot:CAMPEP_0185576534 /NCGR_PEP_ID=MMETSP0434-20130131/7441_1 /TAXON_ID=626734 ORGANISM="Favella taraikaensis, Strain Fe Narragansett Bay" /NCGR_SAMPLE_ID=MMETSP0434 /ASSEMBLY_ACC=CAM_ASM_000379 /LENGTH=257 /DNA_ID=CAMNT_0028193779 /DNA_START=550 /DNA_END=1323 /DNA_ORIENTATION=-
MTTTSSASPVSIAVVMPVTSMPAAAFPTRAQSLGPALDRPTLAVELYSVWIVVTTVTFATSSAASSSTPSISMIVIATSATTIAIMYNLSIRSNNGSIFLDTPQDLAIDPILDHLAVLACLSIANYFTIRSNDGTIFLDFSQDFTIRSIFNLFAALAHDTITAAAAILAATTVKAIVIISVSIATTTPAAPATRDGSPLRIDLVVEAATAHIDAVLREASVGALPATDTRAVLASSSSAAASAFAAAFSTTLAIGTS